jgi:hypothetical protein
MSTVSSNKALAAIALVVTFVVGAVLGVVGDRIWFMTHPPRRPSPETIVRHLAYRLHLSDQQRAQVADIVTRHHQRMAAITSATRPAMQEELEAANREIEQVLTPEQRETFARMRMRLMPMHRRMMEHRLQPAGAPAEAGAPPH